MIDAILVILIFGITVCAFDFEALREKHARRDARKLLAKTNLAHSSSAGVHSTDEKNESDFESETDNDVSYDKIYRKDITSDDIYKDEVANDEFTEDEINTIQLIGARAYAEMNQRINALLLKHKFQQCMTLRLTCGATCKCAKKELHSLLPGEPVMLTPCPEGGVDWIDLYSNGMRIGRFALQEAEMLRETMEYNYIKGAYVAEQNCYGIEDSTQLGIILFYVSKEEIESNKLSQQNYNTQTKDICQN